MASFATTFQQPRVQSVAKTALPLARAFTETGEAMRRNRAERAATGFSEALAAEPAAGESGYITTEQWAEYRNRLMEAAAKTGNPKAVELASQRVTQLQHRGFMDNGGKALAFLSSGNGDLAAKYAQKAYQYMPDMRRATVEHRDGNLLLSSYDEQTGEPSGVGVLTPKILQSAMANFKDPMKFAYYNWEKEALLRREQAKQEAMTGRARESMVGKAKLEAYKERGRERRHMATEGRLEREMRAREGRASRRERRDEIKTGMALEKHGEAMREIERKAARGGMTPAQAYSNRTQLMRLRRSLQNDLNEANIARAEGFEGYDDVIKSTQTELDRVDEMIASLGGAAIPAGRPAPRPLPAPSAALPSPGAAPSPAGGPGAMMGAPATGTIVGGYEYTGPSGDPAAASKRENWKKVR